MKNRAILIAKNRTNNFCNQKHINQIQQKRIDAIEKILRDSPKGVTPSELASYLNIYPSTVARTLPLLESKGLLLSADEEGRLWLFDRSMLQSDDRPIEQLRLMLNDNERTEAQYQKLFEDNPWLLGSTYKKIVRHKKLDDEHIPDLVGIRASDNFMDIFEIKQPFLKLFLDNGHFSNEFYKSWDQAERYLNFTKTQPFYLQQKGLRFENPKCILIMGYDLSDENKSKLSIKESMNPLIQVMTYEKILSLAENTLRMSQNM
ncbi:MAG: Shedu anti-phage system protein SduA domain-containing protein [Chloroflexota bacterium]